MELNKFIDFDQIFEFLFQEQKEDLIEHQFEATYYQHILNFHDFEKKEYDLLIDECFFEDRSIGFIYTKSNNDANESNNHSTECSYQIIYDRTLQEFIMCEYECS